MTDSYINDEVLTFLLQETDINVTSYCLFHRVISTAIIYVIMLCDCTEGYDTCCIVRSLIMKHSLVQTRTNLTVYLKLKAMVN